ncbi:DUF6397 family protein [Streptomyces caelestis]|uniref:Uncharacterized protein n=1 Tax=Streptomyces caelestis TaxID=36816 RepID=A0A7W9LRB2_9ACTN|nr:DUF6397 family protein [Streptomyces caelestis]MBB5793122.1 hypothetical protein [Streptomyces caelestis]GGW63837.1 hypothetical protein GCM10010320_51320 [Streptomyces caelestis]
MAGTIAKPDRLTCAPSRAARELGLRRGEFDLAVNLGLIRTVPDEGGGGRRVARAEIDRLCGEDRFPDALRERVATVGTNEGAKLMDVTPTRFTSLARFGLLVPVRFYLNRYRTVVWLYLAEELRQFASDKSNARLLTGRTPAEMRERLRAGMDRRPRNWRGRHIGFLLRQAGDDPWAHAAAVACLLDPADVVDVVEDPYERAHLNRCRPRLPAHGEPGSPAADRAQELMTASEPDEVAWFRADLAHTMETARRQHPAPRPAPEPALQQVPAPTSAPEPVTAPAEAPLAPPSAPPPPGQTPSHGLLGWLRRRGRRPTG